MATSKSISSTKNSPCFGPCPSCCTSTLTLFTAVHELGQLQAPIDLLGAAGTNVSTGNGLGLDLTKPAPYVLARRRWRETRFVTLLEPSAGDRPIRPLDARTLVVTGGGWEDTIEIDADDVTYTRR